MGAEYNNDLPIPVSAQISSAFLCVRPSSSSPGPPAPCPHSRTVASTSSPGSKRNTTPSRNEDVCLLDFLNHSHTLTVLRVLWEASCCRSGKGVHWMGSTGQLQTERSLALPESSTPSPILISLPLHPYWELQGIQRQGRVFIIRATGIFFSN